MTRFVAVGDLVLADTATTPGFGFGSRYRTTGLAPALAGLVPLLQAGDIVFGNLEAVLAESGHRPRRHRSVHMRGAVRFAADLREAGFTVVNVANNHANQHGDAAFHEMCGHLEAAGLAVCGLPGTDGWQTRPVTLPGRVGLLGYSLHPRQYFPDRVPPFAEGTPEGIRADVGRLRPAVDHLVVSLHWGLEFVTQPSEGEAALGRSILAAGADLVLGHHPHVVRPVEASPRGAIAYSLGNLVADMTWDPLLTTGLLLDWRLGGGPPTLRTTVLDRAYRVAAGRPVPVQPPEDVTTLADEQYRRCAVELERKIRRAKYRHLLRSLPGADWALTSQMLAGVVRGRLGRSAQA